MAAQKREGGNRNTRAFPAGERAKVILHREV